MCCFVDEEDKLVTNQEEINLSCLEVLGGI